MSQDNFRLPPTAGADKQADGGMKDEIHESIFHKSVQPHRGNRTIGRKMNRVLKIVDDKLKTPVEFHYRFQAFATGLGTIVFVRAPYCVLDVGSQEGL